MLILGCCFFSRCLYAMKRPSPERSKKVFFISECLLNQNIRADGVQNIEGDGPVSPIVKLLVDNGVGMTVVACPELKCEGLKRRACGKIRYQNLQGFRRICNESARELIERLQMYRDDGYKIGGFICVNGSPTCGADYCFLGCGKGRSQESGIFVEELKNELAQKGLDLTLIGYDRWHMQQCMSTIQRCIDNLR